MNKKATLNIKSTDKTSDDKDGMKCNGEIIMTRICEVNANMYENTDNVDSVRGDDLRIYNMCMEYGILKNCLLTRATIPLHTVSADTVYPLIHSLLTLRTAIICTLQKLSVYLENKSENSDNYDEKTAKTINPPKRRKSNLKLKLKKSSNFKNVSTS
ncbi:17508_t:CDS:2 [Gigaspora rosea]|nr:17508_t:CDS:2 [Gigaspora rosea]